MNRYIADDTDKMRISNLILHCKEQRTYKAQVSFSTKLSFQLKKGTVRGMKRNESYEEITKLSIHHAIIYLLMYKFIIKNEI